MFAVNTLLARQEWAFLLICGMITCCGCKKSDVGKIVPVSGKVTVAAQPLSKGLVRYIPNSEKGNSSKYQPAGVIGSDGKYTLKTEGQEGAPLGWYKVVISTQVPPGADVPKPAKDAPPKEGATEEVNIDPKYTRANTTDLSIEVVESPSAGQYDVKLIR
jgi:hypothetical protein